MHRGDGSFLRRALCVTVLLALLAGCEFVDKTLLPAATGEFQNERTSPGTVSQAVAPAPEPTLRGAALVGQRQPLVVIRFDQPNVDYEAIVRNAVSDALARRPEAVFDLVGLTPASTVAAGGSTQSAAYVSRVFSTLIRMGIPAEKLSLSATSSSQITVDEVHIYVL